jgi:hypothetical protein
VTDSQQFVTAISATLVPSFAVLVGIILNNARLSDLRPDVNTWFAEIRAETKQRFDHVDNQFELLAKL